VRKIGESGTLKRHYRLDILFRSANKLNKALLYKCNLKNLIKPKLINLCSGVFKFNLYN